MTTETTIPEGYVRTTELLEWFRYNCANYAWCMEAERYLSEWLDLDFQRRFDYDGDGEFQRFTLVDRTEPFPEFVEKTRIAAMLKQARRDYSSDTRIGVPVLIEKFGIDMVEFNDEYTVTLSLHEQEMRTHRDWPEDAEDRQAFGGALRSALYDAIDIAVDAYVDGNGFPVGFHLDRKLDPKRSASA